MAAVSTNVHHLQSSINTLDQSDDEPYSPNTRDTATPDYHEDKVEDRPILSSSFSIQNVLKKERDVNSPENVIADQTPRVEIDYEEESRFETDEADRFRNVSVDDDTSCCSEDTVLSVGNEAQISFNSSAESTSKSIPNSPIPSPNNLTSFKHIQTHLNAISQLSQNINISQPLLLRPNPITPNPLMFLNQQHMLYQNPLISNDKIQPSRIPPTQNFNLGRPKPRYVEDRRFLSPKSDEERRENLKFSIDNILKADFGRRITDPLTKRKLLKVRQQPKEVAKEVIEAKIAEKAAAIDLSKNDDTGSQGSAPGSTSGDGPMVWPAWVYCTRYSDRPSSGRSKYAASSRLTRPRTRRPKKPAGEGPSNDEKRPRTAFSGPQLARLKHEFAENRYLTERRRQALAAELGLAEAQIKIWFQNKRAKIKKASGQRNPLALQLMAQGLYNHSTVPLTREEEELEMKAREREREQQKLH